MDAEFSPRLAAYLLAVSYQNRFSINHALIPEICSARRNEEAIGGRVYPPPPTTLFLLLKSHNALLHT